MTILLSDPHLLSAEDLDLIASHAAESDLAARTSEEVLDMLKARGYFGAAVPTDMEGLGLSMAQCAALQYQIAGADPAVAVALNMHLFSVGVAVEHWRIEKDISWMLLEAIATQNRIVASAFAEPGLGGSVLRSTGTARRDGKNWIIDVVKTPCSLAARSDLICLQVQSDDDPSVLLLALVPTAADGVSVKRTAGLLGMRASESDTLIVEGCVIPDDLVFHRCAPGFDPDDVFSMGLVWFCVTTVATYLGALSSAVNLAAEQMRNSSVSHLGVPRSHLPSYQALLGDAATTLLTLELACSGIAALADAREVDPKVLLDSAMALKSHAARAIPAAMECLIDASGVAGYRQDHPLSRMWRDIQAIRHHPPTPVATRQMLGRAAAGMPYTFELAERAVDLRDEGL